MIETTYPVEHIWTAVWDPAERGGAGAYTYSTSGINPCRV